MNKLTSLIHSSNRALQLDLRRARHEGGKIGWALLWLLGIPLPVLLIIYLIRGH